jgi:uncharacterized membrane protein
LLVASCVVGILSVVTSEVAALRVARIVPGLLIVFIVSGFALVSAVFPERQFTFIEYLLASVGASLAISTTASVALAAAPVGLTRLSFSIALGGCTLILSATSWWRMHFIEERKHNKDISIVAEP